jgi:hypothetical protein
MFLCDLFDFFSVVIQLAGDSKLDWHMLKGPIEAIPGLLPGGDQLKLRGADLALNACTGWLI